LKEKIELNSNAVALRRKFGEDPSSPIDIFSIINNLDYITLLFYPMSDRISGLCIRIDREDSLIAINSNLSYGRQRYTAAHELYHLFFQSQFKNVICGKDIEGTRDVEEKNADAFASFLLAPYDALKIYIYDELQKKEKKPTTLSDIVKIEQHFGMSRQATLYRLKNEGFITADFANTLKSNVIQSARRLGYDDKLYIPTPQGKQYLTTGSYIKLVERLREKDIVSQGKYEELLLDAYRSDIVYNLSSEGGEKYD
jgi:Zn-dependent peptidase ImmA (M78 family)